VDPSTVTENDTVVSPVKGINELVDVSARFFMNELSPFLNCAAPSAVDNK